MPSGRLAVLAAAALALVTAPAYADGRPDGKSLWQAYPLHPTVTATATAADAGATPGKVQVEIPVRQQSDFGVSEPELKEVGHGPPPARSRGGGVPWLPLGLAGLGAGGLAAFLIARRRRRRRPGRAGRHPPLVQVGPPPPRRPTQAAERLRAAVDFRLAREWPWPQDCDGLWRCEIASEPAALSARVAAVVFPPDGPPRELAVAAATDWQSADPLRDAVERLAAMLQGDGWEPVDAGPARRFCWRHDEPPRALGEEAAWPARRG